MQNHPYIIDTRARRGLTTSLNRPRRRGRGHAAQAVAMAATLATLAIALVTALSTP